MSPPTDNIPSPRKRADFPQVFRHERTLANRLRETNHGSTAPPPERCPRQEPLGRNGPPAFTLCHRAGGPCRAPFALPGQGGRKGPSTFPWYRRVGGPIQSLVPESGWPHPIPGSQPRRAFQSCANSERLHSGRGGVAESKIQPLLRDQCLAARPGTGVSSSTAASSPANLASSCGAALDALRHAVDAFHQAAGTPHSTQ